MNTQENVAFLLSFLFLFQLLNKSNGADPCIYEDRSRGIIDLTSVGRTDGTPQWKNQNPTQFDGHGKYILLIY